MSLAKVFILSALILTELPPSRAGSLLHWIGVVRKSCAQPLTLWEWACSRWGHQIQHHRQLAHTYRFCVLS